MDLEPSTEKRNVGSRTQNVVTNLESSAREPSSAASVPQVEGEDGGEGVGQPHHDRHLHLAALRDRPAGHPVREAFCDVDLATPWIRHGCDRSLHYLSMKNVGQSTELAGACWVWQLLSYPRNGVAFLLVVCELSHPRSFI